LSMFSNLSNKPKSSPLRLLLLPFRTSRDEYPRISLTPQLTLVNGW
jgi:hypothetical protein